MAADSFLASQSDRCWSTEQDASRHSDRLFRRKGRPSVQRAGNASWHGPDSCSRGRRKSRSRLVDACSTYQNRTKLIRSKNQILYERSDDDVFAKSPRDRHIFPRARTNRSLSPAPKTTMQRGNSCGPLFSRANPPPPPVYDRFARFVMTMQRHEATKR